METVFFSDLEKKDVVVGFSKRNMQHHRGIAGLKYYLIVMFFRKHVQTFGEVTFSLNQLLTECGYSTNTHNKSMYDDFRKIIKNEILDKGYATSNQDILAVVPSELYTLVLSKKQNIFFTADNFVQISMYEYEAIVNQCTGRTNKSVVLGVLMFIKQYIFTDSNFIQIAYPSKQQIRNGVGVSSITTVESAIKILVDLELIYIRTDLYVADIMDRDVFVPARNVFAIDQKHLIGNAVINELGNFYGREVCNKQDVDGKTRFLKKQKED